MIDVLNRDYVIERYVDDIVGSMDFLEARCKLKDLLLQQKYSLSNDELEYEIRRYNPMLLTDSFIQEILEEVQYG